MKTYWMFWWGRTENPLRQLRWRQWIGVIIIALLFAAFCFIRHPNKQVLICMLMSAIIWRYWVSQIKKFSRPVNLLVPQLRQRLLKTSMAHWTVLTLFFAFAATIGNKLDDFLKVGLVLGCGLLVFAWLAKMRSTRMAATAGIVMVVSALIISNIWHWNGHQGIGLVILLVGWMVMPILAWLSLVVLLRDSARRGTEMAQARKKVAFRKAIHHWFLRKMGRACSNSTLRPEVLERVQLEARLNSSFGPEFHWSSYCFDLWTGIGLILIVSQRSNIAENDFFAMLVSISAALWLPNVRKFMEKHRAAPTVHLSSSKFTTSLQFTKSNGFVNVVTPVGDGNARLIKNLLFLAPGMPQGLALRQALARIALRYSLIIWALCMGVFAALSFVLPATIRFPVLVMVATAELAMIGCHIGSLPWKWVEPWVPELKRIPNAISVPVFLLIFVILPTSLSKYVWFLLAFAPDWYLASISLPLWSASCLLGGAAFLWLRWQKLANEPDGLPEGWR